GRRLEFRCEQRSSEPVDDVGEHSRGGTAPRCTWSGLPHVGGRCEGFEKRARRWVSGSWFLCQRTGQRPLDCAQTVCSMRGERKRRIVSELTKHRFGFERERMGVRTGEEEIHERGERVLLAVERERRRGPASESRTREFRLEK